MKKVRLEMLVLILGVILLGTAVMLLYNDNNPVSAITLTSTYSHTSSPTNTPTPTPTSSPTPSPTLIAEPTATPYRDPYDIDQINREREAFMFILDNLVQMSGFEEFGEPFKNNAGGYSYIRSDKSAITIKEDKDNKYINVNFYSHLDSEGYIYDNELTEEEMTIIVNMMACVFGSGYKDVDEIISFLDFIIESDPTEILVEAELAHGNYLCEYSSSPAWGQILLITYMYIPG